MANHQDDNLSYSLKRWAIIGRLTASLFHEINNPMQAIQGAMSLAMEDLEDTETVRIYLELSLRESARISNMVARVQRVFSLENSEVMDLDLNNVVQEALGLSAKEMSNKRVSINRQLAMALPLVKARYDELCLAILCSLLAMSDYLAAKGGGQMRLSSIVEAGFVRVELSAPASFFLGEEIDLPICRHIVSNYQGYVLQLDDEEQRIIRIALPQIT